MTCFTYQAEALKVKHHFSAIIGPFNASTAEFEYRLLPQEYAVASIVRTNGVFDSLYPFEAKYATSGKINQDNLETTSYKYNSKSRFTKRSKETIYNKNGEPIYTISTKNGKSKTKEILPDINNKNTTDLQTVLAEVAKQYNEVKFCANRMQIFDGKRRFDVILQDEGKEDIIANKQSPFSGKAVKCSMYIDKLSSQGDDLLWELTSDKPIYFWILEDEKTKAPFIAKVFINNTPLGKMNVYTTKIEVTE